METTKKFEINSHGPIHSRTFLRLGTQCTPSRHSSLEGYMTISSSLSQKALWDFTAGRILAHRPAVQYTKGLASAAAWTILKKKDLKGIIEVKDRIYWVLIIRLHTLANLPAAASSPLLLVIDSDTSSSADVGWIPTVSTSSLYVKPFFIGTPYPWFNYKEGAC